MKQYFLGVLLFFTISLSSLGQATIKGPKCVIQGMIYQYGIKIQNLNDAEVCVKGGTIFNSTTQCANPGQYADMKIIWDSASATGEITVKAAGGYSSTYTVQITSEIFGGKITDVTIIQNISGSNLPTSIICSPSKLGNCSTLYSYQWQSSTNYLKWTSISGATNPDLSFSTAPAITTFYRRIVTETKSGTQSYSDIATVVVNPSPTF